MPNGEEEPEEPPPYPEGPYSYVFTVIAREEGGSGHDRDLKFIDYSVSVVGPVSDWEALRESAIESFNLSLGRDRGLVAFDVYMPDYDDPGYFESYRESGEQSE